MQKMHTKPAYLYKANAFMVYMEERCNYNTGSAGVILRPKKRHIIIFWLLHVLGPLIRWRLNYKYEKVRCKQPALILANHVTDWDPILVGLAVKHSYYVASEHTFRWGFASRLINFVFAPIARVKGKTDARTGMEVLRTVRGGHNVCLFAEGNRSYNGFTGPIAASAGKLAQACRAQFVTYRLEGGYFTSPRWAKTLRRGRMFGRVVGVYTASQLAGMKAEEVDAIIQRDLHEDAWARQEKEPVAYKGKRLAEYLEQALYLCPSCNSTATLASKDDELRCRHCGYEVIYTPFGYFEGEKVVYKTVAAWMDWQAEQTDSIVERAGENAIFTDEGQVLYEVKPCVSATEVARGTLDLTRQALCCGGLCFSLAAIADIAITGGSTLTFATTEGKQYEIKAEAPKSALKYQAAYRYLKQERKNRQAKAEEEGSTEAN